MIVTTALTLQPSDHCEVSVTTRGDTVIVRQGDDHQIWIPRADFAEFCRILTEWEAGQ